MQRDRGEAASKERARVLRPIVVAKLSGVRLRVALDDAAHALGVSSRTARRIYNRLKEGDGRLSSIEPKPRGPKKGGRRLDGDREALIATLLDKLYLKRERMSFRRVVREIQGEFDAKGLQPPTRRTVKARLDAMDQREVARRREGAQAARARFQPAIGKLSAERPLEVVQMDHTLADVILVDSEERKPFRRPWVTFAIDIATRMVTGVYATYDAPSALSIALCLDHSVREKSEGDEVGTRLPDWPAFGVPERIHVDNGSDFRSKSFEDACREWGIEVKFRPPGRPHFGGHIERLIGTTMGAVHLLPGTTEASPKDKKDYDSEGEAALTLDEFRGWLKLEIRRYHRTLHSTLKMAPLDRWLDFGGDEAVRRPADIQAYTVSFMPMKIRKLTREGISLFGIPYWSDAFGPLVGRSTAPYAIKYDPRDLSKIWLRAEDGRMIEARYRDLSFPAISLWEHTNARRIQAKQGRGRSTLRATFDIVMEQRHIAEEAKRLTRAQRTARERKHSGGERPEAPPRDDSRKMVAIDTSSTALEAFEIEEWGNERSKDQKD